MKTLFMYLAMLTLFITGTRLVTAQQNYTRSMQTLTPVAPKTHPFQQYLQLASHSVKQTYHDFRSTTDANIADAVGSELSNGSSNSKTNGTLKTTVKNRKSLLPRE